jgi:alkaline phosphatase D
LGSKLRTSFQNKGSIAFSVPVGVAFATGSISAPGVVEALEHFLPHSHPLRALYLAQGPGDQKPQPILNLLLRHGVKSCLEYAKSGDVEKARQLSNQDCRPTFRSLTWEGTDTR